MRKSGGMVSSLYRSIGECAHRGQSLSTISQQIAATLTVVYLGQLGSVEIGESECLKMTLTLFTYLESTNNASE